MPWADKTQSRIDVIGALGLPLTAPRWHEWVTRAQENVETYGGDPAITQIEDYITKYKAAETQLNSNAGKGGLIQADVLKWEPGARNKGYKDEMMRYRNLLLDALFWEGEKAEIRRMSSAYGANSVRIGR